MKSPPNLLSRCPLLALACLALAGCAGPKSRQEMLAIDAGVTRVCTELSVSEAEKRLRAAWKSCFVRPPTFHVVPVGKTVATYSSSTLFVGEERRGNVTTLFTRIAPRSRFEPIPSPFTGAILLMADIQETAECRAEVVVRPVNETWRSRAEYTSLWLRDPAEDQRQPSCPQ